MYMLELSRYTGYDFLPLLWWGYKRHRFLSPWPPLLCLSLRALMKRAAVWQRTRTGSRLQPTVSMGGSETRKPRRVQLLPTASKWAWQPVHPQQSLRMTTDPGSVPELQPLGPHETCSHLHSAHTPAHTNREMRWPCAKAGVTCYRAEITETLAKLLPRQE